MIRSQASRFQLIHAVFLITGSAFLLSFPASAKENPVFAKLAATRKTIADLTSMRERAVESARAHLAFSQSGLKLIDDYRKLVHVRYLNDEGEFDPALPLRPTDIENIRKLIQAYLKTNQKMSNLSAGKAVELLDQSRKKLKSVAQAQESPSDDNNSEIEILDKKISDAQETLEALQEEAQNSQR